MAVAPRQPDVVRFGTFEVNLDAGELRKSGVRVPLQDQPFRLLACLLQNPGRLITREDLRRALWPEDTFVDFDRGLNTAVKRLRESLGDTAETPRFIETVPKHGYRFIAPVQPVPTVQPGSFAGIPRRPALVVGCGLVAIVLAAYIAPRFTRASPPDRIRSIAVLPLSDLSSDGSQPYLAPYLHDALIGTFAELTRIEVTSRTSVLHYASRNLPVRELARALSVDGVVEGSVERVMDRVQVTVRLIEPISDRVLVNISEERSVRDISSLSRDVAGQIVKAVGLTVTPAEARRLGARRPVASAAYESLAKGVYLRPAADERLHREALGLFEQAIAIDPQYAEAHAALAEAWERAAMFGYERPTVAAGRAKAAVLKALVLDDSLPRAHASLGLILFRYDHDWAGADRALQRALETGPHDTATLEAYWQFLTVVCRHTEAIEVARRQLAVDPVNGHAALGWVLLRAGQADRAAAHYEKALAIRSEPWSRANLAASYSALGRHAEATQHCDQAMQEPFGALTSVFCANVYAAAEQDVRAATIVRDVTERARRAYVDPFAVGLAFLAVDPPRSLDWFERAYDEGSPNIVGGLRHSLWLRGLADNRRLHALISRMKYPAPSPHP
jgi:DNA-binding winged helix-turn-helix (wHTH) protein/TolB-like protein